MPAPELILTEIADYDTVVALSKHKKVPTNERKMLMEYYKTIVNGKVKVAYNPSKRIIFLKGTNQIKQTYGRLYAQKTGLARFSKATRATIAKDNYFDIDFENSHLAILKQFLAKNNIVEAFPALIDYTDNRTRHLQNLMDLGWKRDEAKQLYLRLCYGGSTLAQCEEVNGDISTLPAHIRQFEAEVKMASKWVAEKDFPEKHIIGDMKKFNQNQTNNSRIKANQYLSCLLSYIENECLIALMRHLQDKGITVGVLIFDGLMIEKTGVCDIEKILADGEKAITEATGYEMKLTVKDFAEPYELNLASISTPDTYENIDDIRLDETDEVPEGPIDWGFTHKIAQRYDIRTAYFKIKEYVERFITYCEDPACWLYKADPSTTDKPLFLSNDTCFGNYLPQAPVCQPTRIDGKPLTYAKAYKADPFKKKYSKMDFLPYNKSPAPTGDIYNLFRGFAPACYSAYDHTQRSELSATAKQLIRIMAGNDEACAKYAWHSLAYKIQYPERKKGVAWVITGDQGTGKGTFIELLSAIFGKGYVFQVSNPDHLFGTHSLGRQNALITVGNELDLRGTARYEGIIKSAITDVEMTVNPKNINQYTIHSCDDFIITTNKHDPIPVDTDSKDRRFFVTQSANDWVGKTYQEWTELRSKLFAPEGIASLYDELMSVDVENINWKEIPKTEVMELLYESNTSPMASWLTYYFRDADTWNNSLSDHEKWDNDWHKEQYISSSSLHSAYKNYCETHLNCQWVSINKFSAKLRSMRLPMEKSRNNKGKGYTITPAQVGEALKQKFPHLY